jgi:hypothetical protein
MSGRIYGHTGTGEPITDEIIEEPADQAEAGYQPGSAPRTPQGAWTAPAGGGGQVRGVSAAGAGATSRDRSTSRRQGVTASELIRRALHEYFRSA